ncbi:MAG: 4Fe-4S dicluster domain-containing protein [Xanthomonadales bacterium]|nr:4Fe-4S dicluster domain-containing protein [Xanthomonadales bacterium]NIU61754.1 4Fe-4S dicluster domain-containing protein [Stutzerimonas stutzeri]NIX13085.1 4Fe-4S dicluster domain-containing protein [Xanthomonadales bacterium]
MITLQLNGLEVKVQDGTTLLESARLFGFPIPTLCHMEGLSPYGACRLCVVEICHGTRATLVSSCTYPAQEGLKVRTASARVLRARRMVLELLLASCPQSKIIQDLAAAHDVRQQRFRQEHEDCILCGLCVRMCEEQMMAKAIGFRGRGQERSIGTPFDIKSETCRLCGGCMYVCPACQLRCTYTERNAAVCGACANLSPPCVEKNGFDDMMCYMDPCVVCETSKD